MSKIIIAIIFIFCLFQDLEAQKGLSNGKGIVTFISVAPLETIKASSDKLTGIMNTSEATFAFSFHVNSFQGFNSPLQKEHFCEHYLETESFPRATFVGKLIGWDDKSTSGQQSIIAKGKFTIKGITKVLSIPVTLEQEADGIITSATEFDILLSDFDINIPIILEAKIARNIKVSVAVTFSSADE